MSKQSVSTLKSYFNTGDKPTEAQFADLIDSFRHKDEYVPVQHITGLTTALQNYVTVSEFQAALSTKLLFTVSVNQPDILIPQGRLVLFIVLLSTSTQDSITVNAISPNEVLLEDVSLLANEPFVSQVQIYAHTARIIRVAGHSSTLTAIVYVL